MKKFFFLVIIFIPLFSFSQFQKHDLSRQDSALITKYENASDEHLSLNNIKESSRFNNMIAEIYWEHNYFDEAINYYQKSLKLNESLSNENAIAMINSNMALIYTDKGDFDKALKYFKVTLSTRKANREKIGTISALINISVVLNNLKRYDESVIHLLEALDYAREMNDEKQMCSCYGMLSETYQKSGNSEKSLYYYGLYKSFHELVTEVTVNKSNEEMLNERLRAELAETETEMKKLELLFKDKELKKTEDKLVLTEEELELADSAKLKLVKSLTRKELELEYLEKEAEIKDLEAKAKLRKKQKTIQAIFAGLGFFIIIAILLLLGIFKIRKSNKQLKHQNAQIFQQKEEIVAQSEELLDKNKQIEKAYQKVDIAHKQIMASITYAERIQKAFLPSKQIEENVLKEHFVLFKPLEIVSGDFYWLKQINNFTIVATADCTGHGVPGAFMSMLGSSLLNEIVTEQIINNPANILEKMREKVKISLRQHDTNSKDGMDMSLYIVDVKTFEMKYSGAYNPIYIIRDKKIQMQTNELDNKKIIIDKNSGTNKYLIEIKGDRQPVAIYIKERDFNVQKFQLHKGDFIYSFSDGYTDQFGGEKGDKFKSKNFKKLILSIVEKPMKEQRQIFNTTIEEWKGSKFRQIDDILIIGVKV